tara:strand:+ start:818 stop:1192 length:375 start_codon:yes stop_codon:yes gene_type:complete
MKQKSKGLGDKIAAVTKATGIEKVVKTFFGDDCGCDERRDRLNKMFPSRKVEQMNEEQIVFFRDVLQVKYRTHANLGRDVGDKFYQLYQDVFGVKKKKTSCSSCNKNMYIELLKVYESSCTNDG